MAGIFGPAPGRLPTFPSLAPTPFSHIFTTPVAARALPLPTPSVQHAFLGSAPQVPRKHSSTACSSDFGNLAARLTTTLQGVDRADIGTAQLAYNTVNDVLKNCIEYRTPAPGSDAGHRAAYGMVVSVQNFLQNVAESIEEGGVLPAISYTYLGNRTNGGLHTMRMQLSIPANDHYVFHASENGWRPVAAGGRRKKTYRKRKQVRKNRTKKVSQYFKQH